MYGIIALLVGWLLFALTKRISPSHRVGLQLRQLCLLLGFLCIAGACVAANTFLPEAPTLGSSQGAIFQDIMTDVVKIVDFICSTVVLIWILKNVKMGIGVAWQWFQSRRA